MAAAGTDGMSGMGIATAIMATGMAMGTAGTVTATGTAIATERAQGRGAAAQRSSTSRGTASAPLHTSAFWPYFSPSKRPSSSDRPGTR